MKEGKCLLQGCPDDDVIGPVRETSGGDGHSVPHGRSDLYLHPALILRGKRQFTSGLELSVLIVLLNVNVEEKVILIFVFRF